MNQLHAHEIRCKPETPNKNCGNCRRWIDHPEQRTDVSLKSVSVKGWRSAACMYTPISLMGKK